MTAVSISKKLQLRVVRLAGVITLGNGASLCWSLNAEWLYVHLPVSLYASYLGLILAVVVIPVHHDILNLDVSSVFDVVHHLTVLAAMITFTLAEHSRLQNIHVCGRVRIVAFHLSYVQMTSGILQRNKEHGFYVSCSRGNPRHRTQCLRADGTARYVDIALQ